MKPGLFFIAVLLVGFACSGPKQTPQISFPEGDEVAEDSLEYSLETFDAKFETWYLIQNKPSTYRSQSYYENWNRQYIIAWNQKAIGGRNRFFEPIIGYDPTVDYGFELNHELFYYFQYVENVLNIPILANSPKSIVF